MEQVRDEILLEEIKNALTRELNAVDIDINVENGKVALSGFVDVLAEKNYAEEVVSRIPGVVSVDNSLTIAMDNQLTDKEMAEEVIVRLKANPLAQLHSLGAACQGGVVTLKGQVNTLAEKKAALQAAAQVRGVKEVISHLTFKEEAAGVDDATLCNEVERALSLSRNLNAEDIYTRVRNGEVYLAGWVDTKGAEDEAIHRAAAIKGVKKVHSHLRSSKDMDQGDVFLTNQLRRLLGENHLSQVKAFVIDGIAFLGGQVYAVDQKAAAERLARSLDGVQGVSNDINIAAH